MERKQGGSGGLAYLAAVSLHNYLHTRCARNTVPTLSYLGFELNRSNWHDGRNTSFASIHIRHRMQWEGRPWR
jgi:hypothetical protein